jgi:hypothetical protein
MEKVSGMQLNWYLTYWISTMKRIDYGVKNVISNKSETLITLERVGEFPMPVDLLITYKDGSKELYYIPINETLGSKGVEDKSLQRYDLQAWRWVDPSYTMKVKRKAEDITSITIDPLLRMADVERKNNEADLTQVKPYQDPTN